MMRWKRVKGDWNLDTGERRYSALILRTQGNQGIIWAWSARVGMRNIRCWCFDLATAKQQCQRGLEQLISGKLK